MAGEWWERLRERWLGWLGAKPTRSKALIVLNVVAIAVALLAAVVVPGSGRGFDVWRACALMLLGWLALAPTKTLRWVSVFRLFSLTTVWALFVAVLCRSLAGAIDLPIRSAGPSVGIAA